MELYKYILTEILEISEIDIPKLEKVIENRCYKALTDIIKIVRSQEYDDPECFWRTNKIMSN